MQIRTQHKKKFNLTVENFLICNFSFIMKIELTLIYIFE